MESENKKKMRVPTPPLNESPPCNEAGGFAFGAADKKIAIIIGAGPAGLTAAYKLLKETDIHPVILEETDVIGGISQTVVHNGNRMDIGGHRFFSKDDEVMDFWRGLMPIQGSPAFDDKKLGREKPLAEGGPDPETEERVSLVRTRVSRIYFLKKFFDYPITLNGSTIKNMGFANTVRAGFGYMKSVIFKKKEDNLKNFYINRFGKPLYEMFFEDYTEKVWGINPEFISADWGAQRVKGLSLFKAVMAIIKKPFRKKGGIEQKNTETSLIEQFIYPKKGPGQLWEALAEEVKALGGEIRMNTPVNKIILENGRIRGVCSGNERFEGDYYFSSMPIKDLVNFMEGEVPAKVRETAINLPYRDFITVGLLVKRINLKNETKMKTLSDIVPDCWIYVQEREVKLGRIQIFNNWSPYMVEDPENTVWIGLEYFCSEGDEMWNMSDGDFIKFASDELVKIGVIDSEAILDSVRVKIKKAYPSYFGAYEEFPVVREYLTEIENLYCIGRNGQHRYNNMDHSMLTAMEAVRIIKESGDKSTLWEVNAEKEYHEKKEKTDNA